MEIRSFHISDKESVVQLWEGCGLLRPWNNPQKDIERKLRVQPDLFLVAIIDGITVGSVMAGYDGHRGWLYYLAVAKDYRRLGIARKLISKAEEKLKQLGCPKINIQIRDDNLIAGNFYENIGFSEDKVISMGKRLISDD